MIIPIFISKETEEVLNEAIYDAITSTTKKDVIGWIVCLVLGYLSVYLFTGFVHGFDVWGIYGLSFILGNFVGILFNLLYFAIRLLMGKC